MVIAGEEDRNHRYEATTVSNKIASRRLQLAGYCYRHPELSNKKLVLWEPTDGHRGNYTLKVHMTRNFLLAYSKELSK